MKNNKWCGYCDEELKLIVVADMSEKEFVDIDSTAAQETFRKKVLRHEITHAFLKESGLTDDTSVPDCGLARNEEMVDWIATQFPKMQKAFEEVGCL